MSDERHPRVPTFEPLTHATKGRLVLGVAIGSLIWVLALAVAGIVLDETDAIELGLLITAVSSAVSFLVLALLRAARRREERRYADGR